MRKSWFRVSLAAAGVFVVFGQAAAQSVNFWFNSFGDISSNQPSVINVTSGSTAKFSVYVRTTGIGPLSAIGVMFGFSTSTTAGSSAVAADTKATFNSFSWAQADLTSGQLQAQQGGGNGPASGTSRPYGFFGAAGSLGTFAGTGDNIDFKVMDITLNINAAAGNTIGINIWSAPPNDSFASSVYDANSNARFPGNPYTATLNVVPVPEPASLALLGLGAAALIRRRRQAK